MGQHGTARAERAGWRVEGPAGAPPRSRTHLPQRGGGGDGLLALLRLHACAAHQARTLRGRGVRLTQMPAQQQSGGRGAGQAGGALGGRGDPGSGGCQAGSQPRPARAAGACVGGSVRGSERRRPTEARGGRPIARAGCCGARQHWPTPATTGAGGGRNSLALPSGRCRERGRHGATARRGSRLQPPPPHTIIHRTVTPPTATSRRATPPPRRPRPPPPTCTPAQ